MEQRDGRSDVLAFDVGGANIKAADGLGWAHSEPFPLWRRPGDLAAALARIASLRRPRRIVATMTGEIADCFASREEGVSFIVDALATAASPLSPEADLGLYLVDGTIVPPAAARARPLEAAAANWHALARLASAHATANRALVIDVGSTTTDVVPVADGVPAPLARDDVGRMATGELVYTGIERTPVAVIVRSLPWPSAGPGRRPIAAERYADSRDVWLLLGGLEEDAAACDTADGRPATRAAARVRLARMLLADPGAFSPTDAEAAAEWCARAQARTVARALARVMRALGWRPECVVLAGHGGCLARRACALLGARCAMIPLAERVGPAVSRAACAHAVALVELGVLR
ncbi:MAG: H4MPT-linked C1 transfer pathway protein [Planctomycetia bacterium]|nr:H4MPT-linked C1 transfer pathway protein [Planctomycetia bacterium]